MYDEFYIWKCCTSQNTFSDKEAIMSSKWGLVSHGQLCESSLCTNKYRIVCIALSFTLHYLLKHNALRDSCEADNSCIHHSHKKLRAYWKFEEIASSVLALSCICNETPEHCVWKPYETPLLHDVLVMMLHCVACIM